MNRPQRTRSLWKGIRHLHVKDDTPFLQRAAPAKRYYRLKSILFAVLAFGLVVVGFIGPVDELGRWFLLGFILFCVAACAWNFFKSRKADTEDIVISQAQIAHHLSEQEQSVYYLHLAKFGGLAWILLIIVNTFDMIKLEKTGGGSVLFAPLLTVYEKLGFWPAVLLPPFIGVILIMGLVIKGMKLKNVPVDTE